MACFARLFHYPLLDIPRGVDPALFESLGTEARGGSVLVDCVNCIENIMQWTYMVLECQYVCWYLAIIPAE